MDTSLPTLLLFWAKTDVKNRQSAWTKPLLHHMIDVATVANRIWEDRLPHSLKQLIAQEIGIADLELAGRSVCTIAGLHDIGKAIPCFQGMHAYSKDRLERVGLKFSKYPRFKPNRVLHESATFELLDKWNTAVGKRGEGFRDVARALAFHHSRAFQDDQINEDTIGGADWKECQAALIEAYLHEFEPISEMHCSPTLKVVAILTGLVTHADWLASTEGLFAFEETLTLCDYKVKAEQKAVEVAKVFGITCKANIVLRPFGNVFHSLNRTPFEATEQQQVLFDEIELHWSTGPTFLLIEAPTGCGKTEMAFRAAQVFQARNNGSGVFVALPTQATSNGLFERFTQFVEHVHHAGESCDVANVVLVHGTSELHPGQQELLDRIVAGVGFTDIMHDSVDVNPGGAISIAATIEWFTPKKRALLATFGIGTIDQLLMAIIKKRFFYLRLYGLAGKTVIIDEVHAYDVYMLQLIKTLIQWLKALHADVILLSATLPSIMRTALVKAWDADYEPALAEYPCCTIAEHSGTETFALPKPEARIVYLDFIDDDESIIRLAIEAFSEGCSVAIVRNTVARCQSTFFTLCKEMDVSIDSSSSHGLYNMHGTLLMRQREIVEVAIHQILGPSANDRRPCIVVGTQVLEQSLDVDFDVLFTDLAPVDLLIQRMGRVHRHAGRLRPINYTMPKAFVVSSKNRDADWEAFSAVASVYREPVIKNTWAAIRNRTNIVSPTDVQLLIEEVYKDLDPDKASKEELNLEGVDHALRALANEASILAPDKEGERMTELFLSPEFSKSVDTFRTRADVDGCKVLCLFEAHSGQYFLDANHSTPLEIEVMYDTVTLRTILKNTCTVSWRKIVIELRQQKIDDSIATWLNQVPLLRYLAPMIFKEGVWASGEETVQFCEVAGILAKSM